jgi:phage terminase large subunit GpA-like protein
MAEWPVELRTDGKMPEFEGTVYAVTAEKDGVPLAFLVLCPRCGEYGACDIGPEGWSFRRDADGLTMHPSILCRCGGHYFLAGGILRDA